MNDLDLLREFRSGLSTLPDQASVQASWRLFHDRISIDGGPPPVRAPRHRRRWVVSAALAAGVAALLFALSVILPSGGPGGAKRAAAAISFTQHGDYIDAVIEDPLADSQTLEAAFEQHGLDITLQLLPVSPSFVGKFVQQEGTGGEPAIETLFDDQADCTAPGSISCPIGLRIPLAFDGHANITLGRAGEPGEEYVSANDGFASGELLHCSGLRGMTVQDALATLHQLGVTGVWRSNDQAIDKVDGIDPSTIADQFVTDAVPLSEGMVYIWAAPEVPAQPEPGSPLADYYAKLDRGC
jgi:hypothetical protein